jgi:hypothetical protein
MYLKPSSLSLRRDNLTDLLGPVETQYNIEVAECSGCSELSVVQDDGEITSMTVVAAGCDGEISGFQITAIPVNGLLGTAFNAFVPVSAGSFADNAWTGNPGLNIPFGGEVRITCDVVSMGSTGPVCSTTVFVQFR